MKELSIEEKAKAYDEALKKAKDMLSYKEVRREDMEYLFPELAESEDERIRKFIKDVLDSYGRSIKCPTKDILLYEKSVAWLEKQGESDETKAKMFLINKGYPIDANGIFPTYEEMYNIIREGLEKQGEQKVSEYDVVKTIKERIVEHFNNHLIIDKCFSIGGLKDDILKIINEVKFEKQGEQKTTEEITSNPDYISPKDKALFEIATVLSQHEDKDGSPLEEIRSILVNYGINNLKSNEQKTVFEMISPEESLGIDSDTYNKILDECVYGDGEKKQTIDYLENLPKDNWELVHEFVEKFGRIPKDEDELNVLVEYILKRQKTAWSDEDEKMLNDILMCGERHCYLDAGNIDWLKSLRPQNKYAYNPYKAVVESIAAMVEKYAPFDSNLQDFYNNVKVKCKDAKEYDSLYPQLQWKSSGELDEASYNVGIKRVLENPESYGLTKYNWKPSDEQIETLEQWLRDNRYKGDARYSYPIFDSLYQDLKKLKGE